MAGAGMTTLLIALASLSQSPASGGDLRAIAGSAEQMLGREGSTSEQRFSAVGQALDALDKAASDPSASDERRLLAWSLAVGLVDRLSKGYDDATKVRVLEDQAARWVAAQAEVLAARLRASPRDASHETQARQLADNAAQRLEPRVTSPPPQTGEAAKAAARLPSAQLTLARVYALRADLLAEADPAESQADRQRATRLLSEASLPPAERADAELLKACLQLAQSLVDDASATIERAAALKPPPNPTALLAARVDLQLVKGRFDDARRLIEAAKLPDTDRAPLQFRVALAAWRGEVAGPARNELERAMFDAAWQLRAAGHPEAIPAAVELAQRLREPSDPKHPEAWELLADGHLALGRRDLAGRLYRDGATHAAFLGRKQLAWTMQHRAAAVAFQLGDYAGADQLLTELLAAEPPADSEVAAQRPRASLLDILARQRLVVDSEPRSRERYIEALERHVEQFPTDSTSAEARWSLARLRAEDGRIDDAINLWTAIPAAHRHGLASRLAVARADAERIESLRRGGGLREARRALSRARDHLLTFHGEMTEASTRADLELRRLDLELTPEIGDLDEALAISEQLERSAPDERCRSAARRGHVVALAMSGQITDAERRLLEELERASPGELLDLARHLEAAAEALEEGPTRRRLGVLARTAAEPTIERLAELPDAQRADALLTIAHAYALASEPGEARRILTSSSPRPNTLTPARRETLAQVQLDAGLSDAAIQTYRSLLEGAAPGSETWLDSRYGLALAYVRSGKPDEARRLIEGTAILVPDLGGEMRRDRFERLRRRLMP